MSTTNFSPGGVAARRFDNCVTLEGALNMNGDIGDGSRLGS